MSSYPSERNIAIVGAGIGGLLFAIALKRQLGFNNFTIFEKAYSVGGTWRDNIYPGCSSDVDSHFYSLSTDLNPDWSHSHPFQPEIEEYWSHLSKKYSILPHIIFGRIVTAAHWDAGEQLYYITTEDANTGKQFSVTAHILVAAVGILEIPKFPNIPGMSEYRGTIFHSARWVDMELEGKRVAVIGNGASASQFVPIISKRSNIHITQFCRTPNWVLPPIRHRSSPTQKWMFKHVPFSMRIYRFLMYSRFLKRYILKHAPAKYHHQLVPNYALGCKRVIVDTDYLSTLHQDNIELNWEGIASVVETGIITKKGKHLPFDVVILATGYTADKYPLPVSGTKGQTLQEYHNSKGGPTAYLGTSTPGFPNFFMLGGPNTTTGHTSVAFTEEIQANYIIKLIKPILDHKVSSLDVTTKATDAYNSKIQKRLSNSVFVHCMSWYRVDGKGKISAMFPGAGALFWWWLSRPVWKDYVAMGSTTDEWTEESYPIWPVVALMASFSLLYAWFVF